MRTKIFPDELEKRRKEAVKLYRAGGFTQREVAEEFHVHKRTIEKWVHNYHEDGLHGLDAIPMVYPESALSKSQQRELERALLKGSFELGYDDGLWTCPRISELIKRKFNLSYHPDSVCRVLHRDLGWTVQRPQVKAKEKDAKKIKTWLKSEWPKILKKP